MTETDDRSQEIQRFQAFCDKQAASAQALTYRRQCPTCGGKGYQRVDRDGYEYVSKCLCRKEEERFDLYAKTGIPHKFWNCTLDPNVKGDPKFIIGAKNSPSGSEAVGAASRERALKICLHTRDLYIDHFLKGQEKEDLFGLLLYGDCGLGKTRLAASLLLDLLRAGLTSLRFIEYNELFKQIRFSYTKGGPSYQGLFEGLIQSSVLVIDDFGMEVSGDHVWVLDNIGYIINERYAMSRPTILTTNYWKPLDDEFSKARQEELRNINEVPSWNQKKLLKEQEETRKEKDSLIKLEQSWEKVSYRLRSRLSEMCLQVKLEGKDFRQRLAKKRDYVINQALERY